MRNLIRRLLKVKQPQSSVTAETLRKSLAVGKPWYERSADEWIAIGAVKEGKR
jgi:hypothetical protein